MSERAPMLDLCSRLLDGDVRALGRVCRAVDDRAAGYRNILRALYPRSGNAWVIGVTGSPGVGKSTLTDRLIEAFRRENSRVGVIAVDPTSPFSGGAILGDRIRMQRHFEDPEVFIRSVATRGALGGLSPSASDLVRVLGAWGAGVVLVETVGVGQDELDVARASHTTLVVVAPGMGDDIQAIKAGILECADVFAVNKADREGADATARDLSNMIALGELSLVAAARPASSHAASALHKQEVDRSGSEPEWWRPAIVRTVSTTGQGVDDLVSALRDHHNWLKQTEAGRARQSARLHAQLASYLREELAGIALAELGGAIDDAVHRIEERETDPYTECERLVEAFRKRG